MRWSMVLFVVVASWLPAFASIGSSGQTPAGEKARKAARSIDPEKTYVLAIGSCVPWKGPHTCRATVHLFVEAATARLAIPRENILTVTDREATYDGVVKGFTWLSRKSGPDKTVMVYHNGHGSVLPEGSGKGNPEYVFVLWSKKFPFAGLYAVLEPSPRPLYVRVIDSGGMF
jgi:hypothetical protein